MPTLGVKQKVVSYSLERTVAARVSPLPGFTWGIVGTLLE